MTAGLAAARRRGPVGGRPPAITGEGIDRCFYEVCVLSELKNALRRSDISVHGSRQFRDVEEYLLPPAKFRELLPAYTLPVAINPDLDQYLLERVLLRNQQLATVSSVKDRQKGG